MGRRTDGGLWVERDRIETRKTEVNGGRAGRLECCDDDGEMMWFCRFIRWMKHYMQKITASVSPTQDDRPTHTG